jgi:hypothetical protein
VREAEALEVYERAGPEVVDQRYLVPLRNRRQLARRNFLGEALNPVV